MRERKKNGNEGKEISKPSKEINQALITLLGFGYRSYA